MRAAREVFSELGYDAATFQAIAIRADLTRPAINHYFASKRLLYRKSSNRPTRWWSPRAWRRPQVETSLLGRLSAFFSAAMQADSEDRSAAAFLVTSVLEGQRHPELRSDEHDSMRNSRAFVSWAVNDAIEKGELTTDTDVPQLVEMLVAVMWGMGFYAGYVGSHNRARVHRRQARAAVGQQAVEARRVATFLAICCVTCGDVGHTCI